MSAKARAVGIGLVCLVVAALSSGATALTWQEMQGGSSTLAVNSHPHKRPFSFPNGGRQIFPDYRLVALYGSPQYPALGALGEQSAADSITRVKALATQYQPLTQQHVLPTLEIITTVASAYPTADGDYSAPTNPNVLQPWIDAAQAAGVYVVLDLQPGRTDFLTQAKQYESLLAQPNVGLALDPEWRLGPNEFPIREIGSVGIAEVNQTAQWLADLTTANKLPQKLLVLHQFRLDMIQGRAQLDTSYTNLAYVIQMDGNGTQGAKQSTWQAITADPPSGASFGWKNFYKVDTPMLDPAGTMAITPQPAYVSYQ